MPPVRPAEQLARNPVGEGLLVLGITLPLAVYLRYPTLWFLVPFAVLTVTGRSYERFGLSLQRPGSPRFHMIVCLVIFGGYAAGHYAFGRWLLDRPFQPHLRPDWASFVVGQILTIGLCEEFFFRGYLQTLFNQRWGRPYRFLGAAWGPGLLLSAVLFGLCHLVTGDWTRLRVIFFGLFAGWLRERTDTIAVPAAYHGVSNILYDFMQRAFL